MSSKPVGNGLAIAVLLPSRDAAATIAQTIRGFAEALPDASIHVFDGDSSDDTAREAGLAGARVVHAPKTGRTTAAGRMFADVEADIYVVARSDGGCDPSDAPSLINALVTEHVDMVVGARRTPPSRYRLGGGAADNPGQPSGFGGASAAVSGGYLVATRRFVKSFPALSPGLDIERDMRLHAEQLMIPFAEIALNDRRLSKRPARGRSLDANLRDAWRSASWLRETRPFAFFGGVAALFWIAGLVIAIPALAAWMSLGEPPSAGAAVIATGLMVIGSLSAGCGLILEGLVRSRIEQKRVLFLSVPALGA